VSVLIIGFLLVLAMVFGARLAGGPGDLVNPFLSVLLGSVRSSRVVQGGTVSPQDLAKPSKEISRDVIGDWTSHFTILTLLLCSSSVSWEAFSWSTCPLFWCPADLDFPVISSIIS
jgi:hypothetical protein